MEKFHKLIHGVVVVWAWIFLSSVFFGMLYSAQLIGFDLFVDTALNPQNVRSLHITLMLYGPVMLALSLLPFALFDRDKLPLDNIVTPMKNYFLFWHLFLFMSVVTIMFGVQRELPFYDFAYELNFILAASGVFYIVAIFRAIKHYDVVPLWVKVSKVLLFSAPIALLILMNPEIGQVEKTLVGPHGDNTLGMSLTMIPIFYLLIKLDAKEQFVVRGHIYWIVPLIVYIVSVLYRSFVDGLSYNQEWVAQWLTFAYAPLLYIWCKDAGIRFTTSPYLKISIWAFLFVMIQGNILFFPEIRALFHKNDLVIAHAHIAMAIGIFFMALSVLNYFYEIPKSFAKIWLFAIALMFFPLTYAGFIEAGFISQDILPMWWMRFLSGVVGVSALFYFILKHIAIKKYTPIEYYNIFGFLSDGLGAIVLLAIAPLLFSFLGFEYHVLYNVVFGFMGFVGVLHFIGIQKHQQLMAELTSLARIITATIFFALFLNGTLDGLALLVGSYDIFFAFVYFILRSRL